MRLTKRSNLATIASKVFLSIDTISIYILFIVTVSFATKEYIIYYLAMDFQKVAACCTDTVIIVRVLKDTARYVFSYPNNSK